MEQKLKKMSENKKMEINKDFKFRDDISKKDSTVYIELLFKPYHDIIFRFTKVSVKENDNDSATLNFNYELKKMGTYAETTLRKDKKFENILGLILNTLILDAAEAEINENRKSNTQELDKE